MQQSAGRGAGRDKQLMEKVFLEWSDFYQDRTEKLLVYRIVAGLGQYEKDFTGQDGTEIHFHSCVNL